jgi:hypothetical protein
MSDRIRQSSSSRLSWVVGLCFGFAALAGCNASHQFGLEKEKEEYSQTIVSYNNKVDILWIVDGSATMANHQANLGDNFASFISEFAKKDFDYHMAVASTDAWVREHYYAAGGCRTMGNQEGDPKKIYDTSADCRPTLATYEELSWFRDGDIYGSIDGLAGVRSGFYLLTSMIRLSEVIRIFKTNIQVGIRGDGTRESAFQSMRAVLRRNEDGRPAYDGETHTSLQRFRRSDAYFSVIIVSDEDDQARRKDGSSYQSTQDYVSSFTRFLDGYTGHQSGRRWYSVNSIVVENINDCDYGLNGQAAEGPRYVAIAQATGGIVGNICKPDFSLQLSNIARKVVTLLTRFRLKREPIPHTISVVVDGKKVPKSEDNGWSYEPEDGSYFVNFHGDAVPPVGASIQVLYDPVSLK